MSAKSGAHAELFISIFVMRPRFFMHIKQRREVSRFFAADQLSVALGISRYTHIHDEDERAIAILLL